MEDYLKAVDFDFLTINDSHRLQKQATHLSKKRLRKKIVLSKQRDHDIAELKAAVEFVKKKINAAVVSGPSSGVIANDKCIPK